MSIINQVVKGGGTTPTGTKSITANGSYDVTDYATADVNVPTTAPAHYIEKTVDANGKLVNSGASIVNLNGVTDVGEHVLYGAYNMAVFPANTSANLSSLTTVSGASGCYDMFNGCAGLTSADLSSLATVSGSSGCSRMFAYCSSLTNVDLSALTAVSGTNACYTMFENCSGLTSVDLSALTTVSGNNGCQYMFHGCTGLISFDLSALTTVSGNSGCQSMFQTCTGLTSVDLPSLTTISGDGTSLFSGGACYYMFEGCTGLTSANLPALTTISGNYACQYMFSGCTSLATVYIGGTTAIDFGTRTNQFGNMFRNCPQNIDVYAPAANQAQVEAMSGYPNFGGTGTVTWHWRS